MAISGWAHGRGGLDRFNEDAPGEGTFSHYRYDPDDPSSLSNNLVASIYDDRSGKLWIATFGSGLNQLVKNSSGRSDPITIDDISGRFVRYQYDPTDPQSLSHNTVASIYESQDGILWIGTAGGGVNKLDLQPKAFAHYQHKAGDPNSLSSNDVRAIHVDHSGGLWIGTYGGGLNYVERQSGSRQPKCITHYQFASDDPNSSINTNIVAIEEDQDGMLWVGTSGEGFSRLDPETGTILHYAPDPDNTGFRPAGIRVIYEDRSGLVWFGSWGKGLGRLDPETGQFKVYVHDPEDPRSLSGNAVFAIYEDRAGMLWIGTLADGLNRFDRESESFTRYQNQPDNPQSLGNNTVTAINQDQSGTLWIGTGGAGLNRFDPQTETFSRITENDGLPSNTVDAILPDDNGLLWISTARGLSRFDPQRGSSRNYTVSDGLQRNQFIEASAYKSRDGELFFGGPNGLTAFFPQQIKDDENLPPVVLTNIRLNHLPVNVGPEAELKRSLSFSDKLTLSQDDRVISFEFAPLSYRTPEKKLCRYLLEGFDQDWTEVDSKSFSATYTNLDPGQYVFRVIGSNGDGVWNKESVSINVIIPPPWWETWWFRGRLTALFLLFGIIIGLVGRLGEENLVATFVDGARDMLGVALIVALARGISVVMNNGLIIDTVLYWAESALSGLGGVAFINVTHLIYLPLSFLIPSSSGLATVSMPIMAPLDDLVGVNRALIVTAYQSANGLLNLFTPTSAVVMGGLALGRVGFVK
jgi:streptogramin lyase